jgi:DNA polymerase-1
MSVALCDGDYICYRAICGNTKTFTFGSTIDIDKARSDAVTVVREWTKAAHCTEARVLFTGSHNFRKFISAEYKAGRREKPEGYWEVVAAVKEEFLCDCVDGLEADDLMGILATSPRWFGNSVIVAVDKDMRTIPARVLNPNKDPAPVLIDPLTADWAWMMQTLTGDVTDGYKGIPGCGPKKALKILQSRAPKRTDDPLWDRVLNAYLEAGMKEQDALLQARLARILRYGDYDKSNKEIRLWHPSKPESLPLATVCVALPPTTPLSSET